MVLTRRRALILGSGLFIATLALADQQWLNTVITEGSSSVLTLSIQTIQGIPPTPSLIKDVHAWVINGETGTYLMAPTAVTPAATIDMAVPPGANRVVDGTKDIEEHVVTAVFLYGASCTPSTRANCTVGTSEAHFNVRRLRGLVVDSTAGPSPAPTPTP